MIRANYLQEQADVTALVRGVKLARYFGEAASYVDLKGEEMLPGAAMKRKPARLIGRKATT